MKQKKTTIKNLWTFGPCKPDIFEKTYEEVKQ